MAISLERLQHIANTFFDTGPTSRIEKLEAANEMLMKDNSDLKSAVAEMRGLLDQVIQAQQPQII